MAKSGFTHKDQTFTQRKGTQRKERFNDVEFVQFELSEEQKQLLKAQPLDALVLDDLAVKLVEADYRVSLKWDDRNECHACYIQRVGLEGDNVGAILTGRGSSPLKALRQALFKHFVALEEQWGSWRKSNSRELIDD